MFELTFFKRNLQKKKRSNLLHQKKCIKKRFYSSPFKSPELPVLDNIANKLSPDMRNTGIFALQHMVPTTASLFDAIVKYFNVKPKNIFCSGKFYSTCPEVEEYMISCGYNLLRTKPPKKPSQYHEYTQKIMEDRWEEFYTFIKANENIEKIIILDEGGHCLKYMPKKLPYLREVSCIEQTSFGFYNTDYDSEIIPLIDVARSATKRKLESPLIAEAIISRISDVMRKLELSKDKVCGIIGNGAIGSAVTKYLLSEGYTVIAYDECNSAFPNLHNRAFYRVDSMKKVIAGADIIFGCTGKDVSKQNDIFNIAKQNLTLVSCTSQNIEFLSFLKKATKDDFFVHRLGENLSQLQCVGEQGQQINILENGFPINFDRTPKSDPVKDMELTRALLFCAIIQGFFAAKMPVNDGYTINKSSIQMLNPIMQKLIVNQWIVNQPKNRYSEDEINCFNSIDWIIGNSSGDYEKNNIIDLNFAEIEKTRDISSFPNPSRF